MEDKAVLANIPYYNNPSRKKFAREKGLKYLEKYSSPNRAVFLNPDGRIDIAYRGSTTASDWYNNIFGLGDIKDPLNLKKDPQDPFDKDPDFKKDKQSIRRIRDEYPDNKIDHLGHSRGGSRARSGFYTDPNREIGNVYTFNSAFTPNEIEKYNDYKVAYPDAITNYKTKKDLVSGLLPKDESIEIDSKSEPLMSKGTQYIAKQAVKPVAEYFGIDPKTAETAFDRGVSVGNTIKERADAHSMTNFLPEEEMERLVKSGSESHYDEDNYEGFSKKREGRLGKIGRERKATEEYNKIMYGDDPQPNLEQGQDDPPPDLETEKDDPPPDLETGSAEPPPETREKIKNIIDKEREDRDIKTIRELLKQTKYEKENPKNVGKERPPEIDDLFAYTEADNLKRDEELEYINLTRGGFIYLHSGNGDTGGRFVNYANNPYGIDDALGQAYTCDWFSACNYPQMANSGFNFTNFKNVPPMAFHAVGGANGQFFQTGAIKIDNNDEGVEGVVKAHGVDTSEMTFHWERPFRAPQGYNLTLTCIKARIDETHYNIHNSMANEAVPKYWGYCNQSVDTTLFDEATPHGGVGVISASKPNPFFYSGMNVMMANRFLPPLNTIDPNSANLKFSYNPLAYRGKGLTQGMNQITGNDTLLITVQYGYRGTYDNGRSITTVLTIKAGKYSGQQLADQINKQLEETQINFTFADNIQEVCPIPADKKRLSLKNYIDVEWLPAQMKFKFRNRSPHYTQGIVGLGPAYITGTTFYVFLIVAPSKLTWSNIQQGTPPYVNRLIWANPFPQFDNGILVGFDNRMCLHPLGIPNLDRARIVQGQPLKGNIDPVSGQVYKDGIGTGYPSNLSKPNPALPVFDYQSIGTIPIYSEVSGSSNPTYEEGSTLYGQATAGGQGYYVMLPRFQETRWFPNSGVSNPNVWMPQINLVGCPPKKKYEVGISETRNAFQQVTNTDDLTKIPQNDEGVFISPMTANLQRTRNVRIEIDYDTNSATTTTNWASEPDLARNSDYSGTRPYLFSSLTSNSNIIATVPMSNPMFDSSQVDAVYEPDNPFNMKTIRIPNNSFKRLTIRLKDEAGNKFIQNGGQYDMIFKVGLIPTQTTKFSLPTLNEYNMFIRKFYASKNEREKNIQKNKIINL